MADHFMKKDQDNLVIAAPDAGSAKMTEKYARMLDVPMVVMDKRRYSDNEKAHVLRIIGDVKDRDVIIIDDEVATGNSLIETVYALKTVGRARRLYAGCSHGVLSNDALSNIEESYLEEFVTTNSIDQTIRKLPEKMTVLSVAKLFADAIAAVHMGTSVSKLFM